MSMKQLILCFAIAMPIALHRAAASNSCQTLYSRVRGNGHPTGMANRESRPIKRLQFEATAPDSSS